MENVPAYIPYHVHSKYSNALTQPDSTMSIMDYGTEFKRRNIPVLCITEHGNRSDVWEQYEVAQKLSDADFKMKAIAGAECYFVPDRNPELKDRRNFHLIVLAKNQTGLRQLNKMLSQANESGFYGKARVDFQLLSELDYRNFLVTTACVGGVLKDEEHGLEYCNMLYEIFRENFYLEIQHHPQQVQVKHNAKILEIYQKYGYPLIYATDSHYIRHEDAILRKELMKSAKISYEYEDDFDLYLPTGEEARLMLQNQKVFSDIQIEEAFDNTKQLLDFDGLYFDKDRKFPISRPELTQEQRNYVYQKMVCDGYINKEGKPSKEEASELRTEMNTILETNSADYFIGLHDMLQKGIENGGVLTTTSRGSACSFATNYALGFTSINRLHSPVRMYPDRFISKAKLESGSMPDVDSNIANVEAFEQAGREIFGEHSCYPMIAYGKTKALSAFKLLARARDIDFETSNEVSKQISKYELDYKHAEENNQDDPDYDPDDEIKIEDYVEDQYLPLIEESKQYRDIVVTVSPHPCAHLVYHKDLREEIGIIRLKSKTGNKEPKMCVYIDGTTADRFGYVKSDLLRVDVVKIINETFKTIGKPVLTASELIDAVKDDPRIWDLYANGYTVGLNQCEKAKTTQRVMRFKPKNTVELSAFIASIRPGAKSLVDDFVNRNYHNYGVPAMDKLLRLEGATGITGQSSFLFYDEQIMTLAKAAGISPADANALIKHIKKKHLPEVASYKERFIPGFTSYLVEQEKVELKLAEKTADDVWTVILNSASYLFNASHAYAMCLDSLYGAYLKVHYPYEFYQTMLEIFSAKGKLEKVSQIIQEMKKYAGIQITPGRLGEDNRSWHIDKENHTISQALQSVKYISATAAEELYQMSNLTFEHFVDVLAYLQIETSINVRQIECLIHIGYFSEFGKMQKLKFLFNDFFNGKRKMSKGLKSYIARLGEKVKLELEIQDDDMPVGFKLQQENDLLKLCMSCDDSSPDLAYFVKNVDDTYGVKIELYSVKRGTSGIMKMKKTMAEEAKSLVGKIILISNWKKVQRCIYKGKKRIPIPDEYDTWLYDYSLLSQGDNNCVSDSTEVC